MPAEYGHSALHSGAARPVALTNALPNGRLTSARISALPAGRSARLRASPASRDAGPVQPHRQQFLARKRGEAVELADKSDRLHLIKAPVSNASGWLPSRQANTSAPLGHGRRESCTP